MKIWEKCFLGFCFVEAMAFVRMRSVLGTKMAEAMLTARFETITRREHEVRRLTQRVFMVFVIKKCSMLNVQ